MNPLPPLDDKNRRKFVYWLAGAFSALAIGRYFSIGERISKTEEKKEKPVRMLTEDGRLVEVDPSHLTGARRHIETDEIHNWIKNKQD